MKIWSFRASLILLLMTACSHLQVGDNAIRVRGELVPELTSGEECILELRLKSTESPLRSWPISGVFQRTFTVSPQPKTYYVVIMCPRIGEVHRSAPFYVKDITYFRKPIDLGQISVNRLEG
jgi:hypothetical protein